MRGSRAVPAHPPAQSTVRREQISDAPVTQRLLPAGARDDPAPSVEYSNDWESVQCAAASAKLRFQVGPVTPAPNVARQLVSSHSRRLLMAAHVTVSTAHHPAAVDVSHNTCPAAVGITRAPTACAYRSKSFTSARRWIRHAGRKHADDAVRIASQSGKLWPRACGGVLPRRQTRAGGAGRREAGTVAATSSSAASLGGVPALSIAASCVPP